MRLVLQTANVVSDAKNCLYPNRVEAGNAAELQEAIKKDHVCGEYKKKYRSKENFIRSNVAVMDCDNDHSEDPEEWITPEKMEELFGDYSYAIAFSRNHMKVKDGKSARPRFHVYFQIEEITDEKVYAGLKIAIQKQYTFFDDNALDAARFIFGADTGEVIWHEGWMTIDEEISPIVETDEPEKQEGTSSGPILQGSRNNTMSRFASRILKRYGDTEKAHVAFMEHAEKCDPPLPEAELNTIWNSAVRFFNKKISSSDGYVPPDQYNADFSDASLKPEDYSDIGQAKVLVQEYGSELRFSAATDYLRYDGERWVEDVQLAIGAIEEFLDLQLVDAQQDKEDAEKALVDAGIPEPIVKNGSKAVAKEVTPDQMPLLYALMAAETYLKFVLKRRDYKYIISTGNAAKPMIGIDVNELDKHSVAVPKEEQVIVENKHPGIITKEEFIKAQKIFRENRATKRVTEKDYPLWRKVKCGTCGRAMPFKDRIIRGRPYRYFACPHAQAQVGENGCSKEYIREDVLNGVVWESIKTLLAAADGVKEQVKQKQKEADQNNTKLVKKLAKLQKDREKCDAERFANVDQFMAGTLDKEVYQSRRADLTRKADRLDAEIAELEAKYHEAEVIQDDGVQNALEMLDMFSDITELDQDIVGALIEKVLVYDPRHVEIRWKFSDEVMKLLQG